MTVPVPDISLEEIRREIDAIDDGLLDLLIRRFAATAKVRARKQNDGSLAASPLRPAREAVVLRRLIERGGTEISPRLLVRLWRVILSGSTQAQAPVILHAESSLFRKLDLRLLVAEQFCGIAVMEHTGLADAFAALGMGRGDLVLAEPFSPWADHITRGARLISALPVMNAVDSPQILVFGYAEPQPSGDDQTIVLSRLPLPVDGLPKARWQAQSGSWIATSLPGFLMADSGPLAHIRQNDSALQLCVAGHYPSSIEVKS